MPGVTMLGSADPVLAWDGARAYTGANVAAGMPPPVQIEGAAAAAQSLPGGGLRLFRDRLGLGKLFWARGFDGGLDVAARPAELVRAGHGFDTVMAVPRGRMVEFDGSGRLLAEHGLAPAATGLSQGSSLGEAGAEIRRTLDSYLAAVAGAHPGRPVYLCLSGGLDSSTVAVVARRHFPALTAVSFDLAGSGDRDSADRVAARRLAADLGMPLMEATVAVDELLSYLDLVLVEGIDWRDFNVHCGLVNAALGDAIARHAEADGADPPLVITGDLPNEFLVDYHAETYHGATYYALPRLDPVRQRAILVNGLDTCHREVGVFGAFGLVTVQPYAACAEIYMSLPAEFLMLDDRKDRLAMEIVGRELPDYIYSRPKVRAQIGDAEGGGTLAACIDNGIDAAWLRRRFADLHDVDEDSALDRFIRAGRFRAAMPATQEEAHGYA